MKHLPGLLLVMLFLTLSCNKYEEGPAISLRSAESRITGYKKIESYTVSGIDSMNSIFTNNLFGCKNILGFSNLDSEDADNKGLVIASCSSYSRGGRWNFTNKNKTHIFFYTFATDFDSSGSPINYLFSSKTYEWEIIRLTKDEMWLERENGKYELKFRSIAE